MNLETRKISFVQEFLRIQNEAIISDLENYLRKKNAELFESKVNPLSIEQFNHEIDVALQHSLDDKVVSAIELKKRYHK
jgi:hypothetical protein